MDKYSAKARAMWEQYKSGFDIVIAQAKRIPDPKAKAEFVMKYVDGVTQYDSWTDFERAAMIRRINGELQLNLSVIPPRPQADELQDWQKEYNRLFASSTVGPSNLAKLSNAQETQSDVIKKLKSELRD